MADLSVQLGPLRLKNPLVVGGGPPRVPWSTSGSAWIPAWVPS